MTLGIPLKSKTKNGQLKEATILFNIIDVLISLDLYKGKIIEGITSNGELRVRFYE